MTAAVIEQLRGEQALAGIEAALVPPDDLPDPGDPRPPRYVGEEDWYDDLPPMSRVDGLEWELWAGVEQDEAEREMLRLKAPTWVFLPPGAGLAAALEELRPQCESPIALIEAMKAAARMEAWAAAIKTAAMASFSRQRKAQAREIPRPTQVDSSGRPVDPERSWAAEVGAALRLSTNTAARHIDTALHLTGTLPATHTALRCGALTWSKALAISEATRALPDTAAQAVEAHVLRRAPGQTHANLNASLRRQVAKHTTQDAADRHRAAVTERTCKIVPLADGMAGLWVVHTADKIQQMWVVVQAMADLAKRGTPVPSDAPEGTAGSDRTRPGMPGMPGMPGAPTGTGTAAHTTTELNTPTLGASTIADTTTAAGLKPGEQMRDERTAEQRRADVVADVFEHMLHNGLDWLGRRLPDQHRRRPHIEVLIPVTTLLGVDDDPCDLTGYGPVPADMARRIAGDGTWRRLLTDPVNGSVLEASTHRHDPGALVTETLLARHPVCAWPGCNRASRECDRDHATPFKQSGRTSLTGLVPYCEYHHVIKDTPAWGWKSTAHPDGSVTLTAPTGHRYTSVPPARGPITPHAGTPNSVSRSPDDPPPF
ncbi:HNH endonuclease signature motif containing protein [Kribbella soli]|uniref:HNH endonuclease n=1 Tax=Kribbella soli TaxID=1124743 RepID=A0A4R0HPL0_9ACTN|nr:HNH endonuclease signature motif containing protein [Kribbella soli]TCC11984.1 HNH endonuclease [Kribbella soli]